MVIAVVVVVVVVEVVVVVVVVVVVAVAITGKGQPRTDDGIVTRQTDTQTHPSIPTRRHRDDIQAVQYVV